MNAFTEDFLSLLGQRQVDQDAHFARAILAITRTNRPEELKDFQVWLSTAQVGLTLTEKERANQIAAQTLQHLESRAWQQSRTDLSSATFIPNPEKYPTEMRILVAASAAAMLLFLAVVLQVALKAIFVMGIQFAWSSAQVIFPNGRISLPRWNHLLLFAATIIALPLTAKALGPAVSPWALLTALFIAVLPWCLFARRSRTQNYK